MPPAGFEPAIPARERLQTNALDRSATGIGIMIKILTTINIYSKMPKKKKTRQLDTIKYQIKLPHNVTIFLTV